MNIDQINEALVRFDSPPNDLTWENDQAMGQSLGVLAEAARRFVDGWETCPTCGGSRLTHYECRPIGRTMCKTCPDCVDGMIPGPKVVERSRFPVLDSIGMIASKWLRITHDEAMQRPDIQEAATIIAKAVLLASRREEA